MSLQRAESTLHSVALPSSESSDNQKRHRVEREHEGSLQRHLPTALLKRRVCGYVEHIEETFSFPLRDTDFGFEVRAQENTTDPQAT
jgi:hypothetical protein